MHSWWRSKYWYVNDDGDLWPQKEASCNSLSRRCIMIDSMNMKRFFQRPTNYWKRTQSWHQNLGLSKHQNYISPVYKVCHNHGQTVPYSFVYTSVFDKTKNKENRYMHFILFALDGLFLVKIHQGSSFYIVNPIKTVLLLQIHLPLKRL